MEQHSHVFLGEGHEHAEKRTWWVIGLCGAMMVLEIVGGLLFGSIALVADGLHMTTHAGALLLAALAYNYARRHATDVRFTFGTGKLGDLAGFTSAIVLAMISLLIGWEAVSRLLNPVPIAFSQAIPIACLGLAVNIASAWLLSGGDHHHHHHHHHHHDGHAHHHHHHDDRRTIILAGMPLALEIHEDGAPPRFRVHTPIPAGELQAETIRPDGTRQHFAFIDRDGILESIDEIPEPHAFTVTLTRGAATASARFAEHAHTHEAAHRDNNMRAAVIHVVADAAVSVFVIIGLLLARAFGWLWMDPLAGIVGACVIASWAYGLVRDTGRILIDMNPDPLLTERLRQEIEADGDRLTDLHVWRLGPGHLAAVLSIATGRGRRPEDYHQRLRRFEALSHVTVEVHSL
jgi:cation diffusion facilitator family transporter